MQIEPKNVKHSQPEVAIMGLRVYAGNMATAVADVAAQIERRESAAYVCVRDVHGVMAAQRHPQLKAIHNQAFMTVPDGVPLMWLGRRAGAAGMGRVFGPDLMLEVCRAGVEPGWTHYLYGGKTGVPELLKTRLEERFPNIKIVGTCSPPFRPLNQEEEAALEAELREKKPDCFWVGLGTPKQEEFMGRYAERLDTRVMFGVGAAFDIHTGFMRDAPNWMKRAGLQWLHRLWQEPRRLWRRYLINNTHFIWYWLTRKGRARLLDR